MEVVRSGLVARLRARRPEIERTALTRMQAFSDPGEGSDPEYTEGLRAAVCAALEYGIDTLECGEDRAPPIPTALLSQARLAARNQVSLDTVLRRYFAGYTLLGDFVIEEAECGGPLSGASLKQLLRAHAALFDRVIAAVSEEYGRETIRPGSSEERQAKLARRLLAGELLDTAEFAYEFDAWHLGALATGPGAAEALRDLAGALDRRPLICGSEGAVWAWLGARREVDLDRLGGLVSEGWPPGVPLAVGEPAHGLAGWRLTHRQARAALPIALRRPGALVRYADVALLAAVLQDELLRISLSDLYLAPLATERDDGDLLLQTLRAYFRAERNVSSTAVNLEVDRKTVTARLRTVEQRLERPVATCAAELETALRFEEFAPDPSSDPGARPPRDSHIGQDRPSHR